MLRLKIFNFFIVVNTNWAGYTGFSHKCCMETFSFQKETLFYLLPNKQSWNADFLLIICDSIKNIQLNYFSTTEAFLNKR